MKLQDIQTAVEPDDAIQLRDTLLKAPDISPALAYYLLRELFGAPNCGFDDIKSQWAYYIRVPDAYIELYDWKLEAWSIAVYADAGGQSEAERIGEEFLDVLRGLVPKIRPRVRAAAASASTQIIQNPYALYYRNANVLIEQAENDLIRERHNCQAAFLMLMAAFEGLLNLIYELYLRAELRDKRIADRIGREQIDLKIRMAPTYCHCFGSGIDHGSDTLKQFLRVVSLRNDFVHANFTQPMKRPVIVEGELVLIHDDSGRFEGELPKTIEDFGLAEIRIVRSSIDSMRDMLLAAMKTRIRPRFQRVINRDFIEVIDDQGTLSIAYPGHLDYWY